MEIDMINDNMNDLRENRVRLCLQDILNWDPNTCKIHSLILSLENMYGWLNLVNNRLLERECDEALLSIQSAANYTKYVTKVKQQLIKQNFVKGYIICDNNGLCISPLIDGYIKDNIYDSVPVSIDHIDNRKDWNFWE